ncbi:DUF3549 family protein [Pseudoalteromonas denitrificans]|uniref:DUF3549 domain-containing protein n=1 Tax=Pseudoalteromonas denitrificans DSM 6059 TaxID=1123010 RepID=A0A1I1MNQ3_9GAMM|nr:DUF3549 family protein [Pseudoalteromonas denitrificans]SFC84828.1 Protein of unknown function [Pseudoalteromonas denitrificans DSM 6059]
MDNKISTLAQLLDAAGTQWRVFDIGRRITKIDKDSFEKIENAQIPYPAPLQKHALFAILFWDKKATDEPYIWFLKFPLDEESKLVQASRDHFSSMVLEALGTQLTGAQDGKQLNNNPYIFTPNANKRAAFNALMKVETNKPASIYYEQVQLYFTGKLGFTDWQSLSLQGIADFSFRLDKTENTESLLNSLAHIPLEVSTPLSSMLENIAISPTLTEKLLKLAKLSIENSDITSLVNYLRCLSNTKAQGLLDELIDNILQTDLAYELDIILTITGRTWLSLSDPKRLHMFMDKVATTDKHPDLFSGIFADLVAIPIIRPHLLGLLREQNRSKALSTAIGKLFS